MNELPKSVKQWSLHMLRDKLVKIGATVVSHSRYLIFQMAEVAVLQTIQVKDSQVDPYEASHAFPYDQTPC